MSASMVIESQLLATKFFVPVIPHIVIPRPRLSVLLQESLRYPLTLISAPAGFGKTSLLSSSVQSFSASNSQVAWVSLDEGDNEPQLFWTYVLSALDLQQPERFTPLLKYLQSPQAPSLKYVLTALSNLLVDTDLRFVLILDDYHLITEQEVHATLSYLVEHIPPQLHIILATRTDPPLPLSLLRARGRLLEVRANQLRCTTRETRAFLHKVIGIQLPNEIIQEVTTRTEGWPVGLQLLALSLQERTDPLVLLKEVSGDQRYILDYLMDEVLRRQPQEVQTFLLSTCILKRLNASLCDAVMQQTGSQQMLEWLEQANLFVVSLDSKRQWYRYHALFAETLRNRLGHMHGDLVPILHYRASLWYTDHHQTTEAILHAFNAHQWQWVADLIERIPALMSLSWGVGEHELVLLRQWLERLPADVVRARPRLCLACAQLLWAVAPYPMLDAWLTAAEVTLAASLTTQAHEDVSHPILTSQARKDQENLLGEVIAWRAFLCSLGENGQATLLLSQQALALLSVENYIVCALISFIRLITYHNSDANNAAVAVESGLQAVSLSQAAEQPALAIVAIATTAMYMIGTGQLHKVQQLTQEAMLLGAKPGELTLPEVGCSALFQAEVLRERNQLDAALSLAEEASLLCKQTESIASLPFVLYGYAILMRIHLSRGELDAARSTLREVERIGVSMNQPASIVILSIFTTIDQVRLWLACGELDHATRWAEEMELKGPYGTPFARERQDMARARIYLANTQPALALERLEPVLVRATAAQRWGHVIEVRILQALAHQMLQADMQALETLSEALRLAEPEGYIRCFVDEGASMAVLLSKLREQQCKDGPTPFLDKVLTAFSQQSKTRKYQPKHARDHTKRSLADD